MSVLDDLLSKRPEERTVKICLDFELAQQLEAAMAERERTRRLADLQPDDAEAAERADLAAQEARRISANVDEQLVEFTFSSIDPGEFDDLKASHRPTEKQRTDARKNGQPPPEWNIDTFPPALIAACCTRVKGPSGTQEGLAFDEAKQLWAAPNWNVAERAELFNASLAAHMTRTRLVEGPKDD